MLRPALLPFALAALTLPAHADCPTHVDDLPAIGLLTDETRRDTNDDIVALTNSPPSWLQAEAGAAVGTRARLGGDSSTSPADEMKGDVDRGSPVWTGALHSQVLARHKDFVGCASGDVVDIRDRSAHIVGMGHIPVLFSGLAISAAADWQIRLPLGRRREFLGAPLDRVAWTFSIAAADIALSDRASSGRFTVLQTNISTVTTLQSDDHRELARREHLIDVSVLALSSAGSKDAIRIVVGEVSFDSVRDPQLPNRELFSFMSLSPLSVSLEGRSNVVAFKGWLGDHDTGIDCSDNTHCVAGNLAAEYRHKLGALEIGGRLERTGFLDADDMPASEDRATATVARTDTKRALTFDAFAARARPWGATTRARTVGGRIAYSQPLVYGLSALVDGELVAGSEDLDVSHTSLPIAERALVSLAWQHAVQR